MSLVKSDHNPLLPVFVRALLSQAPVEDLDRRVVRGLSGSTEVDFHSLLASHASLIYKWIISPSATAPENQTRAAGDDGSKAGRQNPWFANTTACMRHHVFTQLAVLGEGSKLFGQTSNAVCNLNRACRPSQKQGPHSREVLQIWNHGVNQLVQQGIVGVRSVGFGPEASIS